MSATTDERGCQRRRWHARSASARDCSGAARETRTCTNARDDLHRSSGGARQPRPPNSKLLFPQSVCYSQVVPHARSRPPSRVELARIVRTVRTHRPGAVSHDEGCFGSHGRRPETSVWHVCSSRLGRTGCTWTDNIGKATRETPTALPPPVVQVANAAHK